MCSEVGNTSYGIALNLDIRRQHLPNQWLQPSKRDNQQLVIRYLISHSVQLIGLKEDPLLTAKFPNAALAAL
jgi:hypothetical protein